MLSGNFAQASADVGEGVTAIGGQGRSEFAVAPAGISGCEGRSKSAAGGRKSRHPNPTPRIMPPLGGQFVREAKGCIKTWINGWKSAAVC